MQNWTFVIIHFGRHILSNIIEWDNSYCIEGSTIYNKVISSIVLKMLFKQTKVSYIRLDSCIQEGSGSTFTKSWLGHDYILQSKMKPCPWTMSLSVVLILTSRNILVVTLCNIAKYLKAYLTPPWKYFANQAQLSCFLTISCNWNWWKNVNKEKQNRTRLDTIKFSIHNFLVFMQPVKLWVL